MANKTQHCWVQHVASVCMEPQRCWHLLALVMYSLKPVKLLGPCKRTQHCWPTTRNNVVNCCVRLHGPLSYCRVGIYKGSFHLGLKNKVFKRGTFTSSSKSQLPKSTSGSWPIHISIEQPSFLKSQNQTTGFYPLSNHVHELFVNKL